MRIPLAILLLCVLVLTAAPFHRDFSGEGWQGWRCIQFASSSHEQGKGFVLKAGDKGRLLSPKLDISADEFTELRLTGATSKTRGKLFFAGKGEEFREAASVRSVYMNETLLFKLGANPHWKGEVTALRIDLWQGDEAACITSLDLALPPVQLDFSKGDWQGWRGIQFSASTHEKSRGFVLRSGDRGRLLTPRMGILADHLGELRLSGATVKTQGKVYFAGPGEGFREAASVRATYEDGSLVFAMTANPHWRGRVTALRFDLTQGEGDCCITGMRVIPPLPKGTIRTPLSKMNRLSPGEGTLEVRQELPNSSPVVWQAKANAKLELEAQQFDVLGNELVSSRIEIPAGESSGGLPFYEGAAELALRVLNAGKQAVDFSLDLRQQPVYRGGVSLSEKKHSGNSVGKKVLSSPVCTISNIPKSTSEETVWRPEVIVSPGCGRFVLFLNGNGVRTVIADEEISGGAFQTPSLHLRYLPAGEYALSAELDGVPCTLKNAGTIRHRNALVKGLPRVHAKVDSPRPMYVLNGTESIGTMEYLLSDPPASTDALRYASTMADIMPVTNIRVIFRFHKDGTLDFSETDTILQSILLRHPKQGISLCVSVTDPGLGWRANHPEEGIRNERGEYHVKNYRDTPEATSSMASRRWQEDSKAMLRKLIRHLDSIPGGERVVSILPCAGVTWEWIHWGSPRGEMVDYSTHFLAHFHDFLQRKYGTIVALNRAWRSSHAAFSTVPLPTPQERLACVGEFRPPEAFQPQIDFSEAISDLVSGVILELCECVKQETRGRTLTGTYYGYTNYMLSGPRSHDGGHQRLMRLLKNPNVDILMAPSRYGTRNLGEVGGFMFPDASARLHGKLLLSECDVRTFNADNALGRPSTISGSRAVIEREYVNQVAGGAVMRWFDFSRGWIPGDPRMRQLAAHIASQEEKLCSGKSAPLPSTAYCAVLTSERTSSMLARGTRLNELLVEDGYRRLLRSGLACAFYDIEDLPAVADKHRVFVFLNAMTFTEEQASVVRRLAQDPACILCFLPVTGVMQTGRLSANFPEGLLGTPFELQQKEVAKEIRFTEEAKRLYGVSAGIKLRFPCSFALYPKESGDWISLAETPDGKVAFGKRRGNGAKIYWSSLPFLPEQILRNCCIQAGMPAVESEPACPVWLGMGALGVHASQPTRIRVHNLPGVPNSWQQSGNSTRIFILNP